MAYGKVEYPWNERAVVEQALNKKSWTFYNTTPFTW
jgi:hypothetical protein